ncbi:MAG: EutN/CcmL family microcompartment protein [Anaerolineales bacterium]|nr:EutN/CcmL family microcompartment protein [Anaerolineales bacterium]
MQIALVIGSAVATIKDEKLHGRKLLLVRQTDATGEPIGPSCIAIDTVGAGAGDLVIVTEGSSARLTGQTDGAPVDMVIVGVIDSLEVGGRWTYRKQ